jgi:CheY-like chemotaxis protein
LSPAEPAAAATSALRILVVDDNVDAADGLAELLTLWHHTPRVVHDGLAALEAANAFVPDVVLLDLGLPKLDGLEVARRLRKANGPSVPVLVAITGFGQPVDQRRSADAGFDHHLVKPVEPDTLRDLLARLHCRRISA